MAKIGLLLLGVLGLGIGIGAYFLLQDPPMPQLEQNPYWGPGKSQEDDETIKPFKINIPQKDIDELNSLLRQPLRLTPPLEGANFTYGMNTDTLKGIVEFWKTKHSWKNTEKKINNFKSFRTQIEGLKIHFIYEKAQQQQTENGKKKTVVPLLLMHGWPGSFVEFLEIIPLLTSPRDDSDVVFDIVVPSLPGYGFSDASSKMGLSAIEISQIMKKLMNRLGYEEFFIQGGDWGSFIGSNLATLFPDSVLGLHLNMIMPAHPLCTVKLILGSILPKTWMMAPRFEKLLYPLSSFASLMVRESGYMHLQGTKPDTLGAGLTSSPIGLAAYILEKFSSGSNKDFVFEPDGGFSNNPIPLEIMIDNVALYWFTNSMTTAMRLYAESLSPGKQVLDAIPVTVPTGFSYFKNEFNLPPSIASSKYRNIVLTKYHDVGGHFAAMERPHDLAADVHEFCSYLVTKQ